MWAWLQKQLESVPFLKQLTRLLHARPDSFFSLLPRTRFDYQRAVGKGYGSSVVMAPVKFIQRVFPEAPLRISIKEAAGEEDQLILDHGMLRLIRKPNPFYSGHALWSATIACRILEGNAYWIKWRGTRMDVQQLWWVPPWMMEPKFPEDSSEFISHYEYRPKGGVKFHLPVEDIVHFRNGLDPRNPRLGFSDLHAVLREIFSDDEASNFVASMLRNVGVPGVVIAPKNALASSDDANAVEEKVRQNFSGDRRGMPLVLRGPTDVHQFAWSPAQMELASLRDVSEERVTALIGIPAAVVGFGAGLQQTKVGATMRELVQLAWISCITPMQHAFGEDLENQLLPDFEPNPERFAVFFDMAMVEALQESEKEKAERLNIGVQGAWVKRSEARRAFRLPVTEADEVYLQSPNVIAIGKDFIQQGGIRRPIEERGPSGSPEEN